MTKPEKEKPILFSSPMVKAIMAGQKTQTRRLCKTVEGVLHPENCPFGNPGSRLWVRETWQCWEFVSERKQGQVCYRATNEFNCCKFNGHLWRPSIFMPRWASRILLEITDLRVERLQEISFDSMKAEGCMPTNICGGELDVLRRDYWIPLWHTIHAADGQKGWVANPWVWVIGFKVVKP